MRQESPGTEAQTAMRTEPIQRLGASLATGVVAALLVAGVTVRGDAQNPADAVGGEAAQAPWGDWPAAAGPPAGTPVVAAGGLQWQILQNPNTPAASVVILDPVRRVLAVYQVDSATGQISLKSVRKLAWDLELEGFNTKEPLPSEVRDTNKP
jgi:hypothetical protein